MLTNLYSSMCVICGTVVGVAKGLVGAAGGGHDLDDLRSLLIDFELENVFACAC